MSGSASRSPDVALVFTGGDPMPPAVVTQLPEHSLVIAADSGLALAQALAVPVDVVVGDLDSVPADVLAEAVATGATVEAHPSEKDATDLELALEAALGRGVRRITVVGGHGGRLDHFLANALLLAADTFAAATIDAWMGDAHVSVVRAHAALHGKSGSLCTLLAVGGPARGITTTGLQYALTNDELLAGSSRGVSNVLTGPVATVTVDHGVLLAIQPDAVPHASEDS